jgi:lipoyl(octanoyl) transferase
VSAGEAFDRSACSPRRPAVREWFCIDTAHQTGEFNMKYDLGLVEEFRITGRPVLRFYGWKPYCISLGKNQAHSDINAELAGRDGIDIVMRPTGGKAVLHAEELTYSVVMETRGMSVSDSYNMISTALVGGLRTLGADLELSKSSADFQKLFRDPSAIPCFSTSAVYEVEHRGRKLVGSAQHRFGDILLQHGSILIGDFHGEIVKYLNIGEELRKKTRQDLESHTTTLKEVLGREIGRGEIIEAVKGGIEKTFDADFSTSDGMNLRRKIGTIGSR